MKIVARAAGGALLAAGLLALGSCYPFLGSLPANAADAPAIQQVPYSGTFTYTVNTGSTPKDVYFVFTNPSTTQDLSTAPSVSGSAIMVDGKSISAPVPQLLPSQESAPTTTMGRIAEFNRDPRAHLSTTSGGPQRAYVSGLSASADFVGQPATFRYSQDGSAMTDLNATCRLVRSITDPRDGKTHALSIWVANANWNGTDGTLNMVTPALVTALADRFMLTPNNTADIYHWDTDVVGQPWGPQSYSDLITWDSNSTITILLADLNTSYSGAVTVGYFWAKDNFRTAYYSDSNQRIMFYIDATLYSTVLSSETASGWQPGNYWPKIVYSTLAHEFQHMIHFYQKQVVQGASNNTDTWINEMCSMIMEDLVAQKQQVEGPRGVAYNDPTAGSTGNVAGRIPDFNTYSYYPLVQPTSFDLYDYSTSYAFGAWLARNFGGAKLLQRIVQCPQTDQSAVVNAVKAYTGETSLTFTDLLERWAAAVLLSDTIDAPQGYQYNTGAWFTSITANETYNLGSIDVFNYSPTLKIFSSSSMPTGSSHSSNIYWQAKAGLTGSKTWTITLPSGVLMNVVVK